MIPGELTEAVRTVTRAFGDESPAASPEPERPGETGAGDGAGTAAPATPTPQLGPAGRSVSLDAATAADEAGKQAAAAVDDARAEAEAAQSPQTSHRTRTSGD